MRVPESRRGKKGKAEMAQFATELKELAARQPHKWSSRGWCYILEGAAGLPKSEFNRAQKLINHMRKTGLLPLDFCDYDVARPWWGVESADAMSAEEHLLVWLQIAVKNADYYDPDWWIGEEYYIQMMVEKKDLVTVFKPICQEYHIPITTAKGWSDINQRAEMVARYKKMEEERGLTPILLYGGDFDPWGLMIGDTAKKNLTQLAAATGWMPDNLIVDRFCLNLDFIESQNIPWIENLGTSESRPGKPNDLSDPRHHSHNQSVVQKWLRDIGARKVEANAIAVIDLDAVEQMCRDAIEVHLGTDALTRFADKKTPGVQAVQDKILEISVGDCDYMTPLLKAIEKLEEEEESEDD